MITKIIGYIIAIYFAIALFVFIPYYNWNYAKTHGFTAWLYFDASAKSMAWPFYGFDNETPEDNKTPEHVTNALDGADRAIAILNKSNRPYSQISTADRTEIMKHLRNALGEAKQANIESMNKFYLGFGDHFSHEYIPGLEQLIASQESGNWQSAISAKQLLDNWDDWHAANIDAMRKKAKK